MSASRTAALLFSAATAAMLIGCTASIPTPTAAPVSELAPGEYRSTSATSATDLDFADAVDPVALTIEKDGNYRLTITGDCSARSGPFQLEDGVLTVTHLAVPFAACLPPAHDIDVLIDALLAEPVTLTPDGDALSWSNSAGEIVFVRAD